MCSVKSFAHQLLRAVDRMWQMIFAQHVTRHASPRRIGVLSCMYVFALGVHISPVFLVLGRLLGCGYSGLTFN
jgi:hypothetical protein